MEKSESRKLYDDLLAFKKTELYRHLLKSRQDSQWEQINLLIDLASRSKDDNVRAVARAIQHDAVLWGELAEIEASGRAAGDESKPERKARYGPYEVPA